MRIATLFALVCVCLSLENPTHAEPLESVQAKGFLKTSGVRGGLIVHLGCGDGRLTVELADSERFLVEGLDTDPANVEATQRLIEKRSLVGRVSVDGLDSSTLPYVDNLVNLVIASKLGEIPMREITRVLAPAGVVCIHRDGQWVKSVKPRPDDIDQWTHFLHDASGNAVAEDTRVGPPRHVQWIGSPLWTRNHHKLASISSVVTAAGRLFYIVDEASAANISVPGKWSVVGRDAFSGVGLWQTRLDSWAWHGQGFRSGPVQLPRTLVASSKEVYVPLGLGSPVSALDAATGQVVRKYHGTQGAEEIVLADDVLMVVTGSPNAEHAGIGPNKFPFPNSKSIVAFRADSSKSLWKWTEPEAERLMPLTLASADSRVFFQSGRGLICLDLESGDQLWRSIPKTPATSTPVDDGKKSPRKSGANRSGAKKPVKKKGSRSSRSPGWSVATLVVQQGVVLWANGGKLQALSVADGKPLWECPSPAGFRSPADVFVADGLVWLGPNFSEGRNLKTGQVERTNTAVQDTWTVGHHHRCYREKASTRYIMTGKRGIEFLDLNGEDHSRNNWIRGTCQYGIMPANGLIYAPAHTCGCFMEAKLYGFWALAPGRNENIFRPNPIRPVERLHRGAAYGHITPSRNSEKHPDDWPTLRHDPLRSGSTIAKVALPLDSLWKTGIGGRLSAPVVSEGTVVVAEIETHRVIALDAVKGTIRWTFTAGGRVDSPPTLHRGLVLFGSTDGKVQAVRLTDGVLAWSYRIAPENRKTVALDQLESVWPVHGSVLVQNGVAYTAAGRSSYLDGGIFLFGLDPMTGKVLSQSRVRVEHPKNETPPDAKKTAEYNKRFAQNATDFKTFTSPDRSDAFSMAGTTSDVLVGDGQSIYLRQLKFDRHCKQIPQYGRHLLSTSRILDDAEVHRSHWVLGTGDFRRTTVAYSWIANSNAGKYGQRLSVPNGLMLSFDHQTVWGVRRNNYVLFAESNRPFTGNEKHLPDFRPADGKTPPVWQWSTELGMRPRVMVRAAEHLIFGGMPLPTEQIDPTDLTALYEGRSGGLLTIVSTENGEKLTERKLDFPPVWDGTAVANGRLYLTDTDGKVICMGKR